VHEPTGRGPDLILAIATTVIVTSLIVQGLTLEPLARRAGIARADAARHEETVARLRLAEAALARLEELAAGECAAGDVIDRARACLQARLGHTRARIDGTRAPEPDGLTDRQLRRDLNAARTPNLPASTTKAPSARATRQQLQRSLDLEAARLSEQG
jgi:CPA1 family monovalent cation:H+ antiporter